LRARHGEHRAAFFENPCFRSIGTDLDVFGLCKDGREIPIEIQLAPLGFDDELVAVASIRDVSDRKQARDAERGLAAVVKSTLAAIVVLDGDGTIHHWNQGAERLYGYTAAEACGKCINMLIPPDKSDEFAGLFRHIRSGAVIGEHETVQLHKDGSHIDVSLALSLIVDGSFGPVRISYICRDIRGRKMFEKQMAELVDTERQRLARELHETVGQECSAISVLAAALKQQLGDIPRCKEIVDRLAYCAETAKSRLRRSAKGLVPVDLDAAGLRVALEDLAEETSRSHEIECRHECPASISLHDNFVATQLYLIIREAVQIAVRRSSIKQIVIEVEESDGLRIHVHDDGTRQCTDEDANGMGLHIMRHRCGLIGGQLQCSSHKDGGTTVTLFLPATR
jgi:PAS domain S-box-containing protein